MIFHMWKLGFKYGTCELCEVNNTVLLYLLWGLNTLSLYLHV